MVWECECVRVREGVCACEERECVRVREGVCACEGGSVCV